MQVEEDGVSKSPNVMLGIGANASRESGPTSVWSLIVKKLEKSLKEEKQMAVMVTTVTGASTSTIEGWHAINWQRCHENVKRLQARITKAVQTGKWNKVKTLQRLLTSSFSGKVIAVKRVTDNQGRKTSGVDKETWPIPACKYRGALALRKHGYRPMALRRIYISKGPGKKGLRALSIPTMRDRAMQALHLLALDPIAEVLADRNSYGFRKGRSTTDAIEQCFIVLSRKSSAAWILEADIKNCFCEISKEWMIDKIPMDKQILTQWLDAGYVEKGRWHATETGTPAGGIISPTIMNMTLDGLEKLLKQKFAKQGSKVNMVRYCDDFIITGSTKEILENEVRPLVENFLKERGLRLSDEKTHITHIQDGFDFLGVNVRKYSDKCLIKPSKGSMKRVTHKLRQETKVHRSSTQETLIGVLNPVIRGWTNYHRYYVSKQAFQKLGKELWEMTWSWSKRRHPGKGQRWIKDKYFHAVGRKNWSFAVKVKDRKGFDPAAVPIKRHIKMKEDANPYDPSWYTYCESRRKQKIIKTIQNVAIDRPTMVHLFKQQNGKCPLCKQSLTSETGWHCHHIRPKATGGTDEVTNLVLLHPNCHRQHHVKLKVVTQPANANKREFTEA